MAARERAFSIFLVLSILLCIRSIILAALEDHDHAFCAVSCGQGDYVHALALTAPFASCTLLHHALVVFLRKHPPGSPKWWGQALNWSWMVLWMGWIAITITQGIIRQDVFKADDPEKRWAVALVSIDAVEVVVMLALGILSRRDSWIGGRKAETPDLEFTGGYRDDPADHAKISA